jgi:hypothetical protein
LTVLTPKSSLVTTLAGLALLCMSGVATAQPVRPHILFIFDTSTSMLANNADGSPLCSNNGQNSRIFRLKQAIRETLTEVGADEANLGLARFPQRNTPATNRGCFRGHYINAVDTGTTAGCKTSATNETADGSFFTPDIAQEVVVVPVTRTLSPTAADYDPRGANIAEIHRWLNNVETSDGTRMTDPEIRSGGAKTPLAASLVYARHYFNRYVKPNDPKARCRKNIAVLVTDGEETCGGNAPSAAEELFKAGVEVYVVVQTGEEGNVHNQIADRGSGGARKESIKVDFTNPAATKAALIRIIAESVPPGEICNGIDDNCNGEIDEEPLPGVGNACNCMGITDAQVDKGICKRGRTVCVAGQITCMGCTGPQREICNGIDDDCNGLVDDQIPGVGGPCACGNEPLMTLMTGECKPGKLVCNGKEPLECEGCQFPKQELCDCKDNNCNGQVDEDAQCGEGFACVKCNCELRCKSGEFPCPAGFVCDTKDNICVSTKCANKVCPPGFTCNPGNGQCEDLCKDVKCEAPRTCMGGLCVDCYTTGCPVGQTCVAGRCASNPCANKKCGDGEFCNQQGQCEKQCVPECPSGQRCAAGKCVAARCATSSCGAGEVCDPANGACVPDKCLLRSCPGQRCVALTGDCIDDPCRTVNCFDSCQQCKVSEDGVGYCERRQECVPSYVTVASQGGGCTCAVPGGAAGGSAAGVLGTLAVALGLVLRRRRRRAR